MFLIEAIYRCNVKSNLTVLCVPVVSWCDNIVFCCSKIKITSSVTNFSLVYQECLARRTNCLRFLLLNKNEWFVTVGGETYLQVRRSRIEGRMSELVMNCVLFEDNKQHPFFDLSAEVRGYRIIKCEVQFLKEALPSIRQRYPKKTEGMCFIANVDLVAAKLWKCVESQNSAIYNERKTGYFLLVNTAPVRYLSSEDKTFPVEQYQWRTWCRRKRWLIWWSYAWPRLLSLRNWTMTAVQINLKHSKCASDNLMISPVEENINIALIPEPWIWRSKIESLKTTIICSTANSSTTTR